MKRIVLLAVCLLILAAGCRRGEEEGPRPTTPHHQNYFPLKRGNRWVWIGGLGSAKGDTIIWEVKGKIVRKNGEFAWNVHWTRFWEDKGQAILDSVNLKEEPGLVLLYMDTFDPDEDTVLNYPLTDGKEYTIAYLKSKNVMRTAKIIGKEDVETPYGKFRNAVRIDSQDRDGDTDSLLLEASDWYVPKVGRIRTRVKARGQVWEVRLQTYELH